ncbi:MAG: InlB B-repeat-containing protein, partial [bacterium]
MKKILCLALSVLSITSLTACNVQTSGDFEYTTYYRGDKVAAIVDISEEGKTKATLIFPNIIEGLEVKSIGHQAYGNLAHITIEDATNIYYPNVYTEPGTAVIKYEPSDTNKIINVFYSSFTQNQIYYLYYNIHKLENYNLFIHYKYMDSIYDEIIHRPANITYYVEIGIDIEVDAERYYDSVYFIDDVDGELIVNIPPTPIKEGYEFAGWYKDIEYTQTWDFNNDKVPSKEYDEEG